MTYFLVALGAVGFLLVAFLGYVASKPNSFRVERSATIAAPPEQVFRLIADFREWPGWSPWEKLDPNMARTMSNPSDGVGATYSWEGSKKAGKGSMELSEADPPRRAVIQLRFEKPFKAHNVVDWSLNPRGGGTHVVWGMSGPQPFFFKLMTTVMFDMDKLVGKDFEEGLANLKRVAESS